jgi:hypothetical protein
VSRIAFVCVVLLMLPIVSGCGESSPFETVPVTGTVQMADGSSMAQMVKRSLRFTPNSVSEESRVATGDISPEGAFELGTMKTGDGAIPGKYAVSVTILKTYPPSEAERNAVWVCEPAEVEVTEDMEPVAIKIRRSK